MVLTGLLVSFFRIILYILAGFLTGVSTALRNVAADEHEPCHRFNSFAAVDDVLSGIGCLMRSSGIY